MIGEHARVRSKREHRADLDQRVADAPAGGTLEHERIVELPHRDEATVDHRLADPADSAASHDEVGPRRIVGSCSGGCGRGQRRGRDRRRQLVDDRDRRGRTELGLAHVDRRHRRDRGDQLGRQRGQERVAVGSRTRIVGDLDLGRALGARGARVLVLATVITSLASKGRATVRLRGCARRVTSLTQPADPAPKGRHAGI